MAEPIFGRKRVLMFRKKGDSAAVAKLALQVTHTWEEENSVEQRQTKDGPITISSGYTASLSLEAVATNDAVNQMLQAAVKSGDKIEVWDVDLTAPSTTNDGKYAAIYAIGSLESWSTPADVESTVDLSTTMRIDGVPQFGYTALPPGAVAEIQKAYSFVEIIPTV